MHDHYYLPLNAQEKHCPELLKVLSRTTGNRERFLSKSQAKTHYTTRNFPKLPGNLEFYINPNAEITTSTTSASSDFFDSLKTFRLLSQIIL